MPSTMRQLTSILYELLQQERITTSVSYRYPLPDEPKMHIFQARTQTLAKYTDGHSVSGSGGGVFLFLSRVCLI